jgi:hypothetical protein
MNDNFIKRLSGKLDKFITVHSSVKHIDPSINKPYPIAVVENNILYVFDADKPYHRYKFIMEHYMPDMHIPDEVRACFPLGFYGGKAAAVVSESALDTKKGQVSIFHEFAHCYQNNNECEQKTKDGLLVYKDSLEKNNYMWELNHEFPYNDGFFTDKLKELDAACKKETKKASGAFMNL